MDIQEILKEVNGVFIDVMDDEDIVLSQETTAQDIEEWDSLNHIQLIVATEKCFAIRFTSTEIENFEKVGDMCLAIQQKLSEK